MLVVKNNRRKQRKCASGLVWKCLGMCLSPQYFPPRLSDVKLKIIKLADQTKEMKVELKIYTETVQIWILRVF